MYLNGFSTNSGVVPTTTTATVRYLANSVQPSLLRNGKVGTKRAPTGDDDIWFGNTIEERKVLMHNARENPNISLDIEGFELHKNDISDEDLISIDFWNFKDVVTRYYPAIEEFVKKVTGAQHVFCFDHNLRNSTYVEQKNTSSKTQKPIPQVHTDYTPTSAPKRLLDLTQKPKTNDSYTAFRSIEDQEKPLIPSELMKKCSRFCMLNVWRSVSDKGPIQQFPLAVCAADTLKYPEDFVVFEIQYKDRIGENWFVRDSVNSTTSNHHHKWYYYPRMEKNEALIFKQWDSEGRIQRHAANSMLENLKENDTEKLHQIKSIIEKTSTTSANENMKSTNIENFEGYSDFCIHTAFEGPDLDKDDLNDVPDRESIEVRCFALFE